MNYDLFCGVTGALSGLVATVTNTGVASTASLVLTIACACISGLGVGIRIYDTVKRYAQGKTDAKTAANELEDIASEVKARGGSRDDK